MTNSISGLNLLFSGSNVEEIKTRLQYKLEEYCQYHEINLKKMYDIPSSCELIFSEDLIPKSKSQSIYQSLYRYEFIFKNTLNSDIKIFSLALNKTRYIKLNISSISLLMLFYNENFRNYCNVNEKTRTIVNRLKGVLELMEIESKENAWTVLDKAIKNTDEDKNWCNF